MAPQGKGIPFRNKREIAKHFADNGFNKLSRKSAEKIYKDATKSEKKVTR